MQDRPARSFHQHGFVLDGMVRLLFFTFFF